MWRSLRAWRDRLLDLTHQHSCRGGCPIGSLASELAETDEAARQTLVTEFERWEAPIRAGLHAMRDRGDLRPEADPDQLALAVLAALQGGFLLTQVRREITPLQAALDSALALIQSLHH